MRRRQITLAGVFFIILIGFDQLTKYLANIYLNPSHNGSTNTLWNEVFELQYLENRGAAWGMLSGHLLFLSLITVVVLGAILYFYIKLKPDKRFHLMRFTLVLLAAGAIGNFIDRILRGYVIDFLYFKLINFPIFNVADCYVTIAAVLLVFCILFKYKDEELLCRKK